MKRIDDEYMLLLCRHLSSSCVNIYIYIYIHLCVCLCVCVKTNARQAVGAGSRARYGSMSGRGHW